MRADYEDSGQNVYATLEDHALWVKTIELMEYLMICNNNLQFLVTIQKTFFMIL